jgi:hypothetical protein
MVSTTPSTCSTPEPSTPTTMPVSTPDTVINTGTADLDAKLAVLTPLQAGFVLNFLTSGSATEAYRRAGGKATTPESAWFGAHQLIRNPKVAAAVAALRAERRNTLIADHHWVREQLVAVVNRALQATPVLDSNGEPVGIWRCDLNGRTPP